jgi:hypothetical protein
MNNRHLNHFYIAGFTYYDGVDVFQELTIGTKLTLKAEPENKFDNYAVALYFKEAKLGFVPKGMNKEIFKLLEMGYDEIFEAKINQITPDEHPEQQVGVIIKIINKILD